MKIVQTIGDTVLYIPTNDQHEVMKKAPNCNTAAMLPATVVAVWSEDTLNLKVHLDGGLPDLWVTSSIKGTGEGNWMDSEVG